MVVGLYSMACGISVNSVSYNVCYYPDDLLVCILMITGLHKLIDEANNYIIKHGPNFNPAKTKCATLGSSPFRDKLLPMNGDSPSENDHILHLGMTRADDSKSHAEVHVKAIREAFYKLQLAGLCMSGTKASTITHIFSAAVRPILLSGFQCVYQTKFVLLSQHLQNVLSIQRNLVDRTIATCKKHAISLVGFLYDENYINCLI